MKKLTKNDMEILVGWYEQHHRDLRWRRTKSPYCIWVSEIMLQQTRVEAVKGYYDRFLAVCPDIPSLAFCPDDVLNKLWEGLGYYSRVRNMKKTANRILSDFDGIFPNQYETLLTLPGIGAYTAGAIASIAFGEVVPAVDGNVLRVVTRLTGKEDDITLPVVKEEIRSEVLSAMSENAPGACNQALMELGATVCLPNGQPKCECCPWREQCVACAEKTWDKIPYKTTKSPRKLQKRTVFRLFSDDKIILSRRPDKGLLAGLYQFVNTDGHLTDGEAIDFLRESGISVERIQKGKSAVHIFTHIEWDMISYDVFYRPNPALTGTLFETDAEHLSDYAIPSAFSKFL